VSRNDKKPKTTHKKDKLLFISRSTHPESIFISLSHAAYT